MSRFKAAGGKYYTKQLFQEEFVKLTMDNRNIKPFFSLFHDKPGLINFRRVYVEEADPTGYKVAMRVLDGDYTLWTALLSCRWFVAAKAVWDRELDAKLVSEGLSEIRLMAKDGLPAQKLAAAKFLATKAYRKDGSASKGRPKQSDIDQAAKDLAMTEREVEDDFKRIRGAI